MGANFVMLDKWRQVHYDSRGEYVKIKGSKVYLGESLKMPEIFGLIEPIKKGAVLEQKERMAIASLNTKQNKANSFENIDKTMINKEIQRMEKGVD